MAPVLLDQRRILLIASAFLLGMILAFAGGYFAGYHKAGARPSSVERLDLALPKPVTADPEQLEAVVPEQIEPGADIDVDAPEQPQSAAASTTPVASAAPARPPEPKPETATQQAPAATPVMDPPASASAPVEASESAAEAAVPEQLADDASAQSARYSIQVAIYGSQENAERHVEQLAAQNLSAYLDEYKNNNDETRYNVRFGYFASRASAVTALEIWQQQTPDSKTTGYVVRLSE